MLRSSWFFKHVKLWHPVEQNYVDFKEDTKVLGPFQAFKSSITKNSRMIWKDLILLCNSSHGAIEGPPKKDTPKKDPPGCGFWDLRSKLLGMTGSHGASNYRWIPKKEWWCSTDELTHQGFLSNSPIRWDCPSEPMGLPSSDVWSRSPRLRYESELLGSHSIEPLQTNSWITIINIFVDNHQYSHHFGQHLTSNIWKKPYDHTLSSYPLVI